MNVIELAHEIYAEHKRFAPPNSAFQWRISLQFESEIRAAFLLPQQWTDSPTEEPTLMGYGIVWDTILTRRIIALERLVKM